MRHRYGAHVHQFADLRVPGGDGPFPVAVLLHAGFWREQYTLELSEDLAADLSRRGWATWNVEFRRVGEVSGGGWEQTTGDVGIAIDALADLDAPLDLERVVAVGQSAGGHLALWAAGRRGAVPLAGAVSQAGVPDLAEAARLGLGDGAARDFMGGGPDAIPEAYAIVSPAERLPTGVPQLLVHGDADDVVPVGLSRRYAQAARAAGDDVELVVRAGEDHFVHLDPSSGAWTDVVRWLGRFA
jgi:acetyl esterase/lipase